MLAFTKKQKLWSKKIKFKISVLRWNEKKKHEAVSDNVPRKTYVNE